MSGPDDPPADDDRQQYPFVLQSDTDDEPFDIDLLDEVDPFEIDRQVAHLFKHDALGVDDIYEIWNSDPLLFPAAPPAHWLMVADIAGNVVMIPLAPSDFDDPTKCRPIGCYVASKHLADRYWEDR